MKPSDRTRLIVASVRLRHRAMKLTEALQQAGCGMRTLESITLELIDRLEAGKFTADDLRRMNVVD